MVEPTLEPVTAPGLGPLARLLVRLPRFGAGEERAPLAERLSRAVLKPADPEPAPAAPRSADELHTASRRADDKERNLGFFAAPVAAVIAIVVMGSLVAGDPAARLRSGAVNPLHVSVALYNEVLIVLLALSAAALAGALLRRRMLIAVPLALFGLAVFNLKYWGFGFPFVLAGGWLMVRAYRIQRDLKESVGGTTRPAAAAARVASKRYTPPASARRARPVRS